MATRLKFALSNRRIVDYPQHQRHYDVSSEWRKRKKIRGKWITPDGFRYLGCRACGLNSFNQEKICLHDRSDFIGRRGRKPAKRLHPVFLYMQTEFLL